jgi:hypothetical protein
MSYVLYLDGPGKQTCRKCSQPLLYSIAFCCSENNDKNYRMKNDNRVGMVSNDDNAVMGACIQAQSVEKLLNILKISTRSASALKQFAHSSSVCIPFDVHFYSNLGDQVYAHTRCAPPATASGSGLNEGL